MYKGDPNAHRPLSVFIRIQIQCKAPTALSGSQAEMLAMPCAKKSPLSKSQAARRSEDRWHSRIAIWRLAVFAEWDRALPGFLQRNYLPLASCHSRRSVFRACGHSRHRARGRMDRAAAFYERGLARLDFKWMGMGEKGRGLMMPLTRMLKELDFFGGGPFLNCCVRRAPKPGRDPGLLVETGGDAGGDPAAPGGRCGN